MMLFQDEVVTNLWYATQAVPELWPVRDDSNALSLHFCQAMLQPYLGHLDTTERDRVALTFNRATYALLYAACQDPPERRQDAIDEMKRLVSAYVRRYMNR